MFTLSVLLSLVASTEAFSQRIKIRKTKGLAAVIESSVPLEEGQTYELATDAVSQNVDYRAAGFKSRRNMIAFGGSLFTLKGDDYTRNFITLQGRYGWNFTNIELGPVIQFSSDDRGAGATSEFTGGAFVDYNFMASRDSKNMIYGVVGLITFGSKQFPSSSGGGSATTTDLNAGGFLKWF